MKTTIIIEGESGKLEQSFNMNIKTLKELERLLLQGIVTPDEAKEIAIRIINEIAEGLE